MKRLINTMTLQVYSVIANHLPVYVTLLPQGYSNFSIQSYLNKQTCISFAAQFNKTR
jgi:hypothetical protein